MTTPKTSLLSVFSCLFAITVAAGPVPQSQNAGKADPPGDPSAGLTEPGKAAGMSVKLAQPQGTYVIGTGDIVMVDVWRENELSQKLAVRPDGMISLPLIGDVRASGRTAEGLAAEITRQLKTYLLSPQVTVILVEVHSKWFSVVGEMTKPGRYALDHPMRVLDALSMAGGFQEFAKRNKIYVLHQANGSAVRLPFHYDKVVQGKNANENIEMANGDTIVVP